MSRNLVFVALGRQVRQLRQAAGLSQEDLADAMGLHRTYIAGIERGQRTLTLGTVVQLARLLGVDPAQLVEDVDDIVPG